MRFNLGFKGFQSFTKMINSVKNLDFNQAALEMKDSAWYSQVGQRAEILMTMMKTQHPKLSTKQPQ